ncbi:Asp23/Gls24 family envelope stress response protein [Paenibacillus sp. IHBB 10380]|uniref:Asp23/Gls24 family envelope stress response protein n=1 Tax=Paenibacillus sp. IHBB 10380 TaxID=1566358 RepID=UPI0005CFCCB1|nr:Asp23/Gls24 family envelope stress response protein [Paenibacillus sp. IHBB 10380]AJS58832.1 hypothetical protein UB51_10490 [Paenibacillus sp. IHBB 10380]
MNNQLQVNIGNILIAKEVIAKIIGIAIQETPGIAGVLAGKKSVSSKNFYKAVDIKLNQKEVEIGLRVIIMYGISLPEVSRLLQANVKKAVEEMTGLLVVNVSIDIAGLASKEDNI